MEKVRQIKSKMESEQREEHYHIPKINKPYSNASKVENAEERLPVHEKLYNLSKKDGSPSRTEKSFDQKIPSINEKSKILTREHRVEEYLYKDALRRQER